MMAHLRSGIPAVPRIFLNISFLVFCIPFACKHAKPQEHVAQKTASSAGAGEEEIVTGPDDGGKLKATQSSDKGVAIGSKGAVASAEEHASNIGVEMMRKGGNAVDAAVAVGFALGVTHPSAGNIGGGGFMVLHLPDGSNHTIDYREMAPGAASPDMYLNAKGDLTKDSRLGPRAAGIPGDVAGFAMAHKKWGKLPWKQLVMPSVLLARDGWILDENHADDLRWGSARIEKYLREIENGKNVALIAAVQETLGQFRHSDGSNYETGDRWRQPDLAKTLEVIAEKGPNAFYTGPLAKKMASEVKAMGGLWTLKDLENYHAIEREPLSFDYRGYDVVTMGPPSAGGIVLWQILAASSELNMYTLDWDSLERIHLYVEALRRIYADRNLLLGDPDFVSIPMKRLMDKAYIKERMANIDPKKATPSSEIRAGIDYKESAQTTHFSVIDGDGMAVSNTYTLNGGFGAKVQIPGTGVTLNNEMDDFSAKVGTPNMFGLVQGPQNSIAAGKRMLSSMTPTILLKDGQVFAVVGSPGGPTITTTVAQIVMRLIDHEQSIEDAVAGRRIHHQWLPDKVWAEKGLPTDLIQQLEGMGYTMAERERIGHANSIAVDPKTSMRHAVADVKRDGGAAVAE